MCEKTSQSTSPFEVRSVGALDVSHEAETADLESYLKIKSLLWFLFLGPTVTT